MTPRARVRPVVNILRPAIKLATQIRRAAQNLTDDAVTLEAAIGRALSVAMRRATSRKRGRR